MERTFTLRPGEAVILDGDIELRMDTLAGAERYGEVTLRVEAPEDVTLVRSIFRAGESSGRAAGLRSLAEALAARVFAQSEILSRRAEKNGE